VRPAAASVREGVFIMALVLMSGMERSTSRGRGGYALPAGDTTGCSPSRTRARCAASGRPIGLPASWPLDLLAPAADPALPAPPSANPSAVSTTSTAASVVERGPGSPTDGGSGATLRFVMQPQTANRATSSRDRPRGTHLSCGPALRPSASSLATVPYTWRSDATTSIVSCRRSAA
jgi:hypothetical protein